MRLDEVQLLSELHPAWRLLRAHTAPLVLSFLGTVFVEGNSGPMSQSQLAERLADHLDAVRRDRPEETRWAGDAVDHLEDWASADKGWLRRFYADGDDEVHYDATPALERAYGFATSLRARSRSHLLELGSLQRALPGVRLDGDRSVRAAGVEVDAHPAAETERAAGLEVDAELPRERLDDGRLGPGLDRGIALVIVGHGVTVLMVSDRDHYQLPCSKQSLHVVTNLPRVRAAV